MAGTHRIETRDCPHRDWSGVLRARLVALAFAWLVASVPALSLAATA